MSKGDYFAILANIYLAVLLKDRPKQLFTIMCSFVFLSVLMYFVK